jgi:hypothetical protein
VVAAGSGAVIPQVDAALCRLIEAALPRGTLVRLDAPKPAWQHDDPVDAVDLFLFGLRHAGRFTAPGMPPVHRCRLSYLVTARSGKVDREHLLLDAALGAVLGAVTMPAHCLLPGHRPETPLRLGVAEAEASSLWASLGVPARACFVATVIAPTRQAASAVQDGSVA